MLDDVMIENVVGANGLDTVSGVEFFDIAVVMVSYNNFDTRCLSSLKAAMDKSDLNIGFVMVDNASSDLDVRAYTIEHIPEAIVILRNENAGFGNSCNRGAMEVSADYYFFLNPDTYLEDLEVFDKLYEFMDKYPKVGVVAPQILYMDGSIQKTCREFPRWFVPFVRRTRFFGGFAKRYERRFLMDDMDHDVGRVVDWVQGSALMIDGLLFDAIGGFDDRYFMYYEDVDLCRSSWAQGRPVYYLPNASVQHAYGMGSAKENGILRNLLFNRLAREHILSWLRYTRKWINS